MRPLTEAERAARRDELANHALRVFAEVGYAKLTLEAVARQAGVAKGTLFLAFACKEDLFLHVVNRSLQAWFLRLARLETPPESQRTFALWVLDTLREDPLLLPLMSLVGPILEQRCTPEGVLDFKRALAQGLDRLIRAWSPRWPTMAEPAWWAMFMQIYASIVGAWSVGEPSDTLRVALESHPELGGFLTSFEELALPMLEAQLALLGRPGA